MFSWRFLSFSASALVRLSLSNCQLEPKVKFNLTYRYGILTFINFFSALSLRLKVSWFATYNRQIKSCCFEFVLFWCLRNEQLFIIVRLKVFWPASALVRLILSNCQMERKVMFNLPCRYGIKLDHYLVGVFRKFFRFRFCVGSTLFVKLSEAAKWNFRLI